MGVGLIAMAERYGVSSGCMIKQERMSCAKQFLEL